MSPSPSARKPIFAERIGPRLGQTVARPTLRLLVILLAAPLAGCTGPLEYIRNEFKVGPNYRRPPAAVAEKWIDAQDPRVRSQPADDSHWWTVFNDPALSNLVR